MILNAAPADQNITTADGNQSHHHADRCRFTGTVRSKEPEDLSGRDIQRQITDQRFGTNFFGDPY
ncbi:hypothetical protein D3C73_1505290 [compost metagenome]